MGKYRCPQHLKRQDELRQRLREFYRIHDDVSWSRIAAAAGKSCTYGSHIDLFANGAADMRASTLTAVEQALDRYPAGWPTLHRTFSGQPQKLYAYPQSEDEQKRQAALQRTDALRSKVTADGPPSPLNREAWEAYWLAQEKPALDGKKHRATPLSRQVA